MSQVAPGPETQHFGIVPAKGPSGHLSVSPTSYTRVKKSRREVGQEANLLLLAACTFLNLGDTREL